MGYPLSSREILDRMYFEVRAKLLEVGATLDRLERAEGHERLADDFRMTQIHDAIDIVRSGGIDRAERIQLLFSDDYDAAWKRPAVSK